jgi:hypothetical protein
LPHTEQLISSANCSHNLIIKWIIDKSKACDRKAMVFNRRHKFMENVSYDNGCHMNDKARARSARKAARAVKKAVISVVWRVVTT